MKKRVAEWLPGVAELLLPPACFLLGSRTGEPPVDWGMFCLYSLLFVIPALAAAASGKLLEDRPAAERFLPFGAGFLWSLASQSYIGLTGAGAGDLFVHLFIPVLASGIILFLTGILRICQYIRQTLRQFRDVMTGKVPLTDRYEDK